MVVGRNLSWVLALVACCLQLQAASARQDRFADDLIQLNRLKNVVDRAHGSPPQQFHEDESIEALAAAVAPAVSAEKDVLRLESPVDRIGAVTNSQAATSIAATSYFDQALPTQESMVEHPPEAYSLQDFEQLALQRHPEITQAEALIQEAQGRWVQAGLPPNPVVGFLGQQLGSGGQGEQNGLLWEQSIVRGGKLQLAQSVVEHEIAIAEAAARQKVQRVLTEVRTAYSDVLGWQNRVDLLQQIVANNQKMTETAKALLDVQAGSRAEVIQAEIALEAATASLHQAEYSLAAAWTLLAAATGDMQLGYQSLSDSVGNNHIDYDYDALLSAAIANSPEVLEAELQIARAESQWRRERAEPVSDVTVQSVLQYDESVDSLNANLQITFPLATANRNQGAIQSAAAHITAARQNLDKIRLDVASRLTRALNEYRNANDQYQHYRDVILPKSEEFLRLVQSGYEVGEFDLNRVLLTQATYQEKQLVGISAQVEMQRQRWIIIGIVGTEID